MIVTKATNGDCASIKFNSSGLHIRQARKTKRRKKLITAQRQAFDVELRIHDLVVGAIEIGLQIDDAPWNAAMTAITAP
jgi:hypothetical protein